MPALDCRFLVISSNITTINTREAGFVLTLVHQVHLSPLVHWLGSAEGARNGPLTLLRKAKKAGGRFRPSGSWRGHRTPRRAACLADRHQAVGAFERWFPPAVRGRHRSARRHA